MVAPAQPSKPTYGLGFDPDLLVGPLYVPENTQGSRIKEQMEDITQKLAKVTQIYYSCICRIEKYHNNTIQ